MSRPAATARRTVRLLARTLLVGAVALAATGCGHRTSTPGDGAAADAPASSAAAAAQPQHLLLTSEDLPSGYAPTGGLAPGYRFTLCGVDLEPTAPSAVAGRRFARSVVGPFVEQRARAYPDDSQRAVLARLRAALPSCRTSRALDPVHPESSTTLALEPLDLGTVVSADAATGLDVVAWRQTPVGEHRVPTDVVLLRRGRTVVLVTSYALRDDPPADAVRRATRAATRLLSGAQR